MLPSLPLHKMLFDVIWLVLLCGVKFSRSTVSINGSMYFPKYCASPLKKTEIGNNVQSTVHCGTICLLKDCQTFMYSATDSKCFETEPKSSATTNNQILTRREQYPKCPNSSYHYIPNTFMCIRMSVETKSWNNARSACKEEGAELLWIACSYVFNYVINFLESQGSDVSFWTGLNDVDDEGKFEWSNGQKMTYENWADAEPNNNGGWQDCVIVGKTSRHWYDQQCVRHYHYICAMSV